MPVAPGKSDRCSVPSAQNVASGPPTLPRPVRLLDPPQPVEVLALKRDQCARQVVGVVTLVVTGQSKQAGGAACAPATSQALMAGHALCL